MQDPVRKYQAAAGGSTSKPSPKVKKRKPAKKRSRQRVKKKSSHSGDSTSVIMVLLCFIGLSFSGVAMLYPDDIVGAFSRVRIRVPYLMAEEKSTPTLNQDVAPAKKSESGKVNTEMLTTESARLTMENTSLNQALEEKRQKLDKKERDLSQLAEDLEQKKVEIDRQLKELQDMRRNISSVLDDRVKADKASVDKLVAVYANMKPVNAARIISSLNEDLAIKILGKMKKQSAAEILNFVEPGKAQRLSEKYAGIKSTQ